MDTRINQPYLRPSFFDYQIFFNNRLKVFEYIEKLGNISTAMLTVNISIVKTFLLFKNYEIRFSLLYSVNGQMYQTKDFYTVEIPGKEGRIPYCFLKALDKSGSVTLKFNSSDLSALYDERDVKIDEVATFSEVIKRCEEESVAMIRLINRGFYTRIVCYDAHKNMIGTIHVGALSGLPADLTKRLYLDNEKVEYTL